MAREKFFERRGGNLTIFFQYQQPQYELSKSRRKNITCWGLEAETWSREALGLGSGKIFVISFEKQSLSTICFIIISQEYF